MKALFAILFLLAGLAQAQIVTPSGRGQWGDSVKWGDSDDSTSYYRFRGNTLARDSSGTWVTTTDSCSRPVRIGRGTQLPAGKLELSYEVRASSGNTDSTRVKWSIDSRYCLDERASLGCQDWVPAGRFLGDSASRVTDVLYSIATDAGTTWKPTRQVFDVPGGNQIRLCVDSYEAGGETGDSTFFRRHVVRTSPIPAGGGLSGGSGGGGSGGDMNLTGINGGTPATNTGNASSTTLRTVLASNQPAYTVLTGRKADDGAFTVATDSVTPVGYYVGADNAQAGDIAAPRMSTARIPFVNLTDSSGNPLTLGSQYSEDAPHSSGDALSMAGAVRRDSPASSTATDLDNATVNTDSLGRVWVNAHPTRHPRAWSYAPSAPITNTTAVTAKAAATGGRRNCITSIQVINGDDDVSTEVLVLDGAAGTVIHRGWAQAAGGGFAAQFPVPICGTANTLIEVDNVTTAAAVYYNLQGFEE